MPDGVTFKITGAAELAHELESKPPIVAREIIRSSLRGAVKPWRDEMVSRVRRGWHVFSSTHVRGLRGGHRGQSYAGRSREFGVIAKNILIRSKIDSSGFSGTAAVTPSGRAYWSKFLEFGTRKMQRFPFMVPAFESRKGDVLNAYIADVRDRLHSDMGLR